MQVPSKVLNTNGFIIVYYIKCPENYLVETTFQKTFGIFLLCGLDQKCSGMWILMVRWGLLFSTFDCLNCASIVMFALSRPFVIMYNLLRGRKAYRG